LKYFEKIIFIDKKSQKILFYKKLKNSTLGGNICLLIKKIKKVQKKRSPFTLFGD